MKHSRLILLAAAMGFAGLTTFAQEGMNKVDSLELVAKQYYTKREVMIPMRDGVKLYTDVPLTHASPTGKGSIGP